MEEEPQAAPAGAEAVEISQGLIQDLFDFMESLLRPWNAYQVLILIGLIIVAKLISRWLSPKYHDWLRAREGWTMARMRWAVVIHKRMTLIFFVILIWLTYTFMREVAWPSRSYLLGIVLDLSVAWLVVAVATRLISNKPLRQVVRLSAWIWVTVSILNLSQETVSLLDSLSVDLGEMRISVWIILQAVFILGLMFFGAGFLSRTATNKIQSNTDLSPSMRVLTVKVLQITLYGAAFFIGLRAVGVDLTGLAVLSGAIGVGLGFGLQKVVSNLVSGVIILLDKSIKPGDVISLGETFGWINSLGARYVSVVTRDGKEYLIPNEDLITGQVVNWSHSDEFVRLDIFFGTSYGDDPHKVRKLAIEAAKSVDRVLNDKAPVCHIVGFGDSSVDYVLRFWIKDPTAGLTNIRGNVYLALWDVFHQNDVSFPFPQREVRLLGDTSDTK